MSESFEELDLLAGEFVLGCLSGEERRDVEARAAADPALRRMIQAWEVRLAPLGLLATPLAPPPALWQRLEAAIAPAARPPFLLAAWRSLQVWRISTAGAVALAAALAAFIILRPAPPSYVAEIEPPGGPAPAFLAHTEHDGSIQLTALSPAPVPAGRDLELWALPAGATRPISLGVIPPGGKRVNPRALPTARTQLLVSLEPAGGSPTGQPTGPVLYAGTFTRVD
jgi:anti-sigma-K factor RskA